jgi:Leucine-rich repeat (LRR) protein
MLTHLVKLDLSKNQLRELPEFFGHLRLLRHLDLYSNQLQRLPVSFAQLKNLKWLDLKHNPLVPALQQAAGPCITPSDCAMCAKKVKSAG